MGLYFLRIIGRKILEMGGRVLQTGTVLKPKKAKIRPVGEHGTGEARRLTLCRDLDFLKKTRDAEDRKGNFVPHTKYTLVGLRTVWFEVFWMDD